MNFRERGSKLGRRRREDRFFKRLSKERGYIQNRLRTQHLWRSSQGTKRVSSQLPYNAIVEFIKYSPDEIQKIFSEGLAHLTETISDSFKGQFSEEIIKNVFNEKRRYELQEDQRDRFSIDETPEYVDSSGAIGTTSHLEDPEQAMVMNLKKTTVLTGNHGIVKQQRNRAQSENEIFTSHFKGSNSHAKPDEAAQQATSAP